MDYDTILSETLDYLVTGSSFGLEDYFYREFGELDIPEEIINWMATTEDKFVGVLDDFMWYVDRYDCELFSVVAELSLCKRYTTCYLRYHGDDLCLPS